MENELENSLYYDMSEKSVHFLKFFLMETSDFQLSKSLFRRNKLVMELRSFFISTGSYGNLDLSKTFHSCKMSI